MNERDYRPAILVAILVMLCLIAVGVVGHFLARRAIRELVERTARRQLMHDFKAMREGRALQSLHSTPSATSKALLAAALNRV